MRLNEAELGHEECGRIKPWSDHYCGKRKKKSCQARLRSLTVSFIYFLTSVLLLEGQKSFFTSAFLSGSPFLSPWV